MDEREPVGGGDRGGRNGMRVFAGGEEAAGGVLQLVYGVDEDEVGLGVGDRFAEEGIELENSRRWFEAGAVAGAGGLIM